MSTRVLLIEHDREMRLLLVVSLRAEGFSVEAAMSGGEARALWPQFRPDALLLDAALPNGAALGLLREFRRGQNLPILVSTPHASGSGPLLDCGAHDYLVKPFGVPELLGRLRAALRRRGIAVAGGSLVHDHEDLHVDLPARQITVHSMPIRLEVPEFDLIATLVRSAGNVVTDRQLLADVWGPESVGATHRLRLAMARLRAKIEREPAEPRHILAEAGLGYRLAAP